MPEREARTVRVDPDVWAAFREQIDDWDGENPGHVGYHVEKALNEYIDHDRYARVEDKLDRVLAHVSDGGGTHTHKPAKGMHASSRATEKTREMIQRIQSNHGEIVKNADVERVIEDIAGADPRTLQKYKRLFRNRGLLFEHPGNSGVWTPDVDEWVSWLTDYGQLNGPDAAREMADEYPVETFGSGDGIQIEIPEETKTAHE